MCDTVTITEYSDYYKKEITYIQYTKYTHTTVIKYNLYNHKYYKNYIQTDNNTISYKSYSLNGKEYYLKFNADNFYICI